jgi:epoxyqueuosine reductase
MIMKTVGESLKADLVELALSMGAVGARVADLEMLEGPPSADPTYLFPETRSVISYALPLGSDWIPDYFGKVTRRVFSEIMYRQYQHINTLGEALCDHLEKRGFKGVTPSPNGVYRGEIGQPGFMIPPFSLRYAALASGLGSLGWSGNVLVKGHWSAVFLGSVLTDALLPPDAPLDENLCDNCKICTLVCPLGFMSQRETQSVILGGREYICNKKGHFSRCGLSCGGFVGISRDGKWSSWATLRYRVPDNDRQLNKIFARAFSDPDAKYILQQTLFARRTGDRGVLDRSLEDTNPTCCNCCLVCSGPREDRMRLKELLHSSGIVVRLPDGTEKAVRPEELDPLFTWESDA